MEVQLDEHKLLFVYGHENDAYERALEDNAVKCSEEMRFITEAEHIHSSTDELHERFDQLCYQLGIDD